MDIVETVGRTMFSITRKETDKLFMSGKLKADWAQRLYEIPIGP